MNVSWSAREKRSRTRAGVFPAKNAVRRKIKCYAETIIKSIAALVWQNAMALFPCSKEAASKNVSVVVPSKETWYAGWMTKPTTTFAS